MGRLVEVPTLATAPVQGKSADPIPVLITIDTEADLHQGRVIPLEQMVYGRIDGEEYGIHRMMDLADDYGAVLTFFVSVFEHRKLGEAVSRVCQEIYERGHEVQLHTHPNWIHDHRFMWGYTLEQQVDLIKEGKDVIYQSIGVYPIAHRAGGFGADENTLIALRENGFIVDSTHLYGPYSKLSPAKFLLNGISQLHGVTELPVTVFNQFRLGSFEPKRPWDINANSLSELKFVLRQAKLNSLPYVNLLMHSFSFVTFDKGKSKITPNLQDLKKFENLMKFLQSQEEFRVVGMGEFSKKITSGETVRMEEGVVPTSGWFRTCARACRYPGKGKANTLLALAVGIGMVSFGVLVWIVIKFL